MASNQAARRWLAPILLLSVSYVAADFTAARLERRLSIPAKSGEREVPEIKFVAPNLGLGNASDLQFVLANTAQVGATSATQKVTVGGPAGVGAVAQTGAASAGPLPRLMGTLAGAGHSLAVLQFGDQTQVSKAGELVGGYKILEVTARSVRLRAGQGPIQTIIMGEAPTAVAVPVTAATPIPGGTPRVASTPMPQATPPPDGSITVAMMKEWMDNSKVWMGSVNVKSFRRGEEAVGLRVTYTSADNPLAKLGINNGDILTGLNGHPLHDPEDFSWAYQELRTATTLNFDLEHLNQKSSYAVHLSDAP